MKRAKRGQTEGRRVAINRPDLQYTTKRGRRVYEEWDRSTSKRGKAHKKRIKRNDRRGKVKLHTVD